MHKLKKCIPEIDRSIESNKVQCCSYSAVVLSKIKFFQYIVDDDESKEWKLYDAGPKQVKCPLVCFPPASGTADVFYKQVLALSAVGFRVISVRVTFVYSYNYCYLILLVHNYVNDC